MRKRFRGQFRGQRVKNAAALLCLAVCLWCAAASLGSWAQEDDSGAGRTSSESRQEKGGRKQETSALPGGLSLLAENMLFSEDALLSEDLLLSNGGVVPFLEDILPGAVATPDPDRASGPVEEVALSGGTQVADFFVRDTTESGTDLAAELLENPSVNLKGDGSVEILLYHTHTSEAYSRQYTGFYYTDMDTRTQNQDMSVVAVGEAVKRELEARGYGVVHDTTINDTLFNGSYARSWEVIQKNLEEHPGIQVTIDLHRDSMTTAEGLKYKPTAVINGRKAAQIMVLAGCNAHDDWEDFPNWRENLRLMLRVQQKAAELYPEFARPMNFSNSKYNMNATPGSMLIEVGTEVNTVSEAAYSGKLLGEVLAQTFDSLQ